MNRESSFPRFSFLRLSDWYFDRRAEVIDLEAKFAPTLLNTAIYLLGLSQQVSTFTINFQVYAISICVLFSVPDR